MSLYTTAAFLALNLGSQLALAQSQPQILQTCTSSKVCYSLSIPENTASTGSGDIYMQISAPTSYQWVALGQGDQMAGSNMFIMYTSADGQNVTVSPRNATGEVMPLHDTAAQVALLEGSGVSDGMMKANIRCSNCQSWSGGTMDLSSGNSNWIYSHLSGSPLDSDDLEQHLNQHDAFGDISWNVAQAAGGDGSNPFVTVTRSSGSGNTGSGSQGSGSSGSNSSGASAGTIVSGGDISEAGSVSSNYIYAHGAMAAVAFVALYPLGALLIRFASFGGLIWVHGAIQIFAYALFIAAAGIGIWTAQVQEQLNTYHAIIGMILLGVIFFMPALGLVHHNRFKVHQRRGIFSFLHIYIGRAAILLGIINGGFGLQLAGETNSRIIAYGVIAGLVGVAYIASFVFGEVRRTRGSHSSSPSLESEQGMIGGGKGMSSH